jgi:prepilin peptidase CpaA
LLPLFGRIFNVMVYATLLTMICVGLLVVAAMHDLAARTIPNALPAFLAGGGFLLHLGAGNLAAALATAAMVCSLAAFCWFRGWLGGGDVKLLGAAALAVPVVSMTSFILDVGVAGGLLALLYLLARRLVPAASVTGPVSLAARVWRAECWRIRRGGPLPYGLAIAAGGVLTLLQGGPT